LRNRCEESRGGYIVGVRLCYIKYSILISL